MKKSKNTGFSILMKRVLFGGYLLVLCYFLFFADRKGLLPAGSSYRYNLTLFQEISRFWNYREQIGVHVAFMNLAGNVVGFMPFGFLLPQIKKGYPNGYKVIVFSFLFSLAVETIQLLTRLGCFDVDDILLNTIGGVLGYLVYAVTRKAGKVS